ncbi:hypothetical protein BB560_003251 [Smittium megazygosporum]|uniref:Transmembrane 9 superfamily member n=1 Tax=Smittium megazygosporum TaxID=133381 RepID=A0A2T9ZCI1_9FUNG|nr:hypothetical protein BB560_003251 [Smittium megazygosporum]
MSEDFGWKLVHADVFRSPENLNLLCVFIGNGFQLFLMSLSTICSLTTSMLFLYMLFGFSAGYYSSYFFNSYGGINKNSNVIKTIYFVPMIFFGLVIVLNFILISRDSSAAVPVSAILKLAFLWFTVNIPLSLLGSYFGYRTKRVSFPVETNQIPRQVPEKVWYLRKPVVILIGGAIPFVAIFVELYYIMMTVLMVYFTLCAEDYNWMWLSFQIGGGTAIYAFLYGVYFYFSNLKLAYFSGMLLYFGWLTIVCLLLFLLTGTIGFVATHYFVLYIYKLIKVD